MRIIQGRHEANFGSSVNACMHACMRAEVLEAEGSCHLLVTHKSILRAHLCVALGLPPTSFRAFDINNGGICTFR